MTLSKRLYVRKTPIAAMILLTGTMIIIGSCNEKDFKESQRTKPRKKLIEIENEAHFNRIIESSNDRLLLFEFYADWCAPCKILEPTLEEIAEEYKNSTAIYKINFDYNGKLSELFKVRGLPHVGFVKNKLILSSMVGLHPKESYVKAIESYLK